MSKSYPRISNIFLALPCIVLEAMGSPASIGPTNLANVVSIDGSVHEGGGQLLRVALVFSSILNKPVHINNIRLHRKSPGLQAEHIASVELARNMCKADVRHMVKDSRQLFFAPRTNLTHDEYDADTKGHGSVTLLMQVGLPLAMFSSGITQFSLKGSTNTFNAPSLDFYTNAWDPLTFKFFGTNMEIRDIRRGFFPKGRGHVYLEVYPVQYLRPIDLTEFEEIVTTWGRAVCTPDIKIDTVDIMGDIVEEYLLTHHREAYEKIDILREQLRPYEAHGNGSAIYLFAETTSRAILSAGLTVQKYRGFNETAVQVAQEFSNLLKTKVCVDDYMQDQLIVLMALAKGKSRIKTGNITLHTKTAIHVAETMSRAKFNIVDNKDGTHIIECDGIGFENKLIDRPYV
uniref:RNA 3'-terminal phosphate cyclase n=1 Tax=Cacopsylla melanoneura TaxID=428564 RepID=A0A8D9ASW5_9HEMI